MRRRAILLAMTSLVYSSPTSFSVNDDFFAFPQYEIVFSDSYISDTDAESRLSFAGSSVSATTRADRTKAADPQGTDLTSVEISRRSSQGSAGSSLPLDSESYEYMVLNSSPYLCSIPYVSPQPKNVTTHAASKADEEKELAKATDRGWELLKDLEGHCMYSTSGWWSYSFCYNKEVRQFHALPPGRGGAPVYPPMEDPNTPSFILGRFQRAKASKKQADGIQKLGERVNDQAEVRQVHTKGDMRYMVQKLSMGTVCDLNGKMRQIEVQFHCHPQSPDRIGWIKEPATCQYLMVIYTPRLCNDAAFLPPRESKAQEIICQEIVPEDQVDEWQARKKAEAKRKTLDASKAEPAPRPVVGDIEVGGMQVVGRDGKRIEPPKAVQMNRPKAEIIAISNPNDKNGQVRRLSDEELLKRDLDAATVEAMTAQLEEMAGNKAWKLEIIDTPGGMRELRGVVDDSDDSDEGDAKYDAPGKKAGTKRAGYDREAEIVMEMDGDAEEGSVEEMIYRDEL